MIAWLAAFTLTSVIEIPIHARALARARAPHRLLTAFAASAITHPFVFLVFPRVLDSSGLLYLLIAESFAVGMEAWWLKRWGVREALLWSLLANATSVAVGAVLRTIAWSL